MFGGIFPEDLVLIGASSGIGKTECAATIAANNASNGKRVHFFALEAEDCEIERRIKYRFIANKYFSMLKDKHPGLRMDYVNWYMGGLTSTLRQYEPEIEAELAEKYKTLFTFYRTFGDYTVDLFEKQILAIQDQTDLVVVDHLHYFDWDEIDDNKAVKRIVKTIRNVVQIVKKPVILVAHMRKRDRNRKQLAPDLEDFHGTSDIGKIATKAITIAPAYGMGDGGTRLPTFMRAAKNRLSSARARYIAVTSFDISKNEYEKEYYIGQEKKEGEFEAIKQVTEIPWWASGARAFETESSRRHSRMVGD